MRLFIKNIIIFSFIIITFFLLLFGYKYYVTNRISFKESPEKHILFTGASHIYFGIDDNLMQTAVNKSGSGELYLFTYLKLERILKDNPGIDTVFIECAPIDLWQDSDAPYFYDGRIKHFVTLYYPLFGKEEWKIYSRHMFQALPLIIQQSFDVSQLQSEKIRHMLGSQIEKKENLRVFNPTSFKPGKRTVSTGNDINLTYLRKIIDLCNRKNIKIYGLFMPAYKPQYYADLEYYYGVLNEHFPDLELLDYHDWEVPDTARYDKSHLNWYGAQIFTKEIKDRFNIR